MIGRSSGRGRSTSSSGSEPDFALLEERDFIRRRPGSSLAGRARVRVQARPDARGRLREPAEGAAGAASRRVRRWLERVGEGATSTRRSSPTTTPRRSARGRRPRLAGRGEESIGCAGRQSAGCGVPGSSRSSLRAGRWHRAAAPRAGARGWDAGRAELWRGIGHVHALNFGGEGFWRAMERSLELSSDRSSPRRRTRSSRCRRRSAGGCGRAVPTTGSWRVDRQALTLSDWVGAPRLKALVASVYWNRVGGRAAVVEASALARRLGDPELRMLAASARSFEALSERDYSESAAWAKGRSSSSARSATRTCWSRPTSTRCPRRSRSVTSSTRACSRGSTTSWTRGSRPITDSTASQSWASSRSYSATGIGSSTRSAHGEGRRCECGHALRSQRAVAVRVRRRSPVPRRARGSRAPGGAREELSFEGFGLTLDSPRIRLALARGQLERVETLVAGTDVAGVLHGLSDRLARRPRGASDRARVEAEADLLLKPGTYLEPFVLRALGLVRDDEQALERALECFEALGLHWHAGRPGS